MFESYYRDLCLQTKINSRIYFLLEEMNMLKEAKGLSLPNFLPRYVFLNLLQKHTDAISEHNFNVVNEVWDYLDSVMLRLIDLKTHSYPYLKSATRRASQALIMRRKDECIEFVNEMIEMEKCMDFIVNPTYMETWNKLMQPKGSIMEALCKGGGRMVIKGIGDVNLE
eukprot:Gb_10002 [translate_table: standard]